MLSDLSTIDKQLYNNVMFLKTYENDAEDLFLTFTVGNNDFGQNNEINLIPNGSEVPVTNENKQRYIGKFPLRWTDICGFMVCRLLDVWWPFQVW